MVQRDLDPTVDSPGVVGRLGKFVHVSPKHVGHTYPPPIHLSIPSPSLLPFHISMGYLSCRTDSSISTCRSISSSSPQPHKPPDDAAAVPRLFTYSELQSATRNFSPSALLGRGSHGAVYRADLPSSPSPLAVKRPSLPLDLRAEIHVLSSIRSPRLVNLLGYTPSTSPRQLIVLEYMPNGTLYDLLHTAPHPPSWPRRIRLALHSAHALLTLHSARPPIIHRDIKSANIMLDARHNARLGDFGLALQLPSALSTPPAGTLGYLDPGYLTPDNLSTKTDVFSFGILLLEIISGRKAIDVAFSPPTVVDWAVPLLKKGKLSGLFDPRIPPPRDPASRRQLAALAASCVRSSKERRPGMAEVVEQLKLLSKSLNVRRSWNVVNPCAVVDTERTVSRMNCDTTVEEGSKAAHQLRNGRKVFSEENTGGGRNLKDLMDRLDRDAVGVLGQRASMNRTRTLRVTGNYHDTDDILRLWRNQTVKEGVFDSVPKMSELKS